MDDENLLKELGEAAQDIARAAVPQPIRDAVVLPSMVGLRKSDGGVRGIATGTTIRRLVGRALAKQFGPAIEAACSPHQYALSTRAGTECVGHLFRATCVMDHHMTVSSIEGIGAFDHIKRAQFMQIA